jgi:hypothetical protein
MASMNLIGQTNGFNLRMAYGLSTSYSSVWEQDSTYMIAGFAADTADGTLYIRLLVTSINSEGEVLVNKYLGDQNRNLVFFEDANAYLDEDHVLLAGRYFKDAVMHGLIFTLNTEGDTISSISVPSPSYNGDPDDISNWMSPSSLSSDSDTRFYVASQIVNAVTGNDFVVFSFSPSGEVNWFFVYATERSYEICRDIEAVADGVWFSAYSYYPSSQWGNVQSFIKLNLVGEVANTVSVAPSSHNIFSDFEIVQDGIVGIGSKDNEDDTGSVPIIFKIDFEGNYLWTNDFPTPYEPGQWFTNLVNCLDGEGFVAVGGVADTSPENPEINGSYNWNGVLAKYSSEGEEVWAREYFILQSIYDDHIVSDLKATSDGGYIFCGESTDSDSENPDQVNPSQQGWVVKVDGCGCLVPDCDPNCTTKEEEEGVFIDSDQQFVVGPVPADWFINVHVLNDEYLDSRRIEIHNLLGQQVLSYATPTGQATYMIDTQSLSSGIYIVSMTEHGRVVQSEKVEVRKL